MARKGTKRTARLVSIVERRIKILSQVDLKISKGTVGGAQGFERYAFGPRFILSGTVVAAGRCREDRSVPWRDARDIRAMLWNHIPHSPTNSGLRPRAGHSLQRHGDKWGRFSDCIAAPSRLLRRDQLRAAHNSYERVTRSVWPEGREGSPFRQPHLRIRCPTTAIWPIVDLIL